MAWGFALAVHVLLFAFALFFEPSQPVGKTKRGPYYTPPIQVEIRQAPAPKPFDQGSEESSAVAQDLTPSPEPPGSQTAFLPAETPLPDLGAASALGSESAWASPEQGKPEGSPPVSSSGASFSTAPKRVELFDPKVLEQGLARWRSDRVGNRVVARGAKRGLGGEGEGGDEGVGGGNGSADGGLSEGSEAKVVAGRINAQLAHAKAVSRVLGGLVDPYFRNLAHGVGEQQRVAGDELAQLRLDRAGQRLLASWYDEARSFGRWGQPASSSKVNPYVFKPVASGGLDAPSQASSQHAVRLNSRTLELATGEVLLQMTQDSEGEPLDVRIVASSGSRELDESALEAVRLAASSVGMPKQGMGSGKIRTLWKLEASLSPYEGWSEQGSAREGAPGATQSDPPRALASDERPGASSSSSRKYLKTRLELVAIYGGQRVLVSELPTGAEAPASTEEEGQQTQ